MTGALIIAAGRPGSKGAFQPLKEVGGLSAAERLVHLFRIAGIERIVLVGGQETPGLEKKVAGLGVTYLHNNEPGSEMLHSVKLGLRYLRGKCPRTLVTPVDVPLFSVETIQALLQTDARAAVPCFEGRAGHPLLLSAGLFPTVLEYEGEGGLAGAVKHSGTKIQYVSVQDAGVVTDVQKQRNLNALVAQHSLRAIRPECRVFLAREHTFFGPGPYLLLSMVDETGAFRVACRQMGLSYSKGWKMMALLEEELGAEVLTRSRGGAERGHSELTPLGHDLLKRYRGFEKASREAVEKTFDAHFGDFTF